MNDKNESIDLNDKNNVDIQLQFGDCIILKEKNGYV